MVWACPSLPSNLLFLHMRIEFSALAVWEWQVHFPDCLYRSAFLQIMYNGSLLRTASSKYDPPRISIPEHRESPLDFKNRIESNLPRVPAMRHHLSTPPLPRRFSNPFS
ncbi:hypothetical protein HGRIS_005390 [Hohenbuehelia grisea]|uniref:Uncharacterized protein n=1 Tax=Hohenbuehelia grisea TaxID=104357 RepID=A0ABR3JFH9_9AGAR